MAQGPGQWRPGAGPGRPVPSSSSSTRAQYGIDLPGSLHTNKIPVPKSLLFWDGTPFWDFVAA